MSPAKTKSTVGVIGLGIMGGSFARNLVAAGWHVFGYDVEPARRRELAKAGVAITKDVAALAAATPIIITSLPKPQALLTVAKAIGVAGVPHRVVVEASTFTIADKQKAQHVLAAAGHTLLDCPISGTGSQAATGDLVIYASGDSKAIAKLKPMFAGFSRKLYDVGVFGNGSKMKYVANLLVAIHNVASAEAMVLGIKAGLDPQAVFDMISNGAGNSRVFELRAPMMVRNDYRNATMKCSVWQKDMDVIGAYARKLRIPTPLFDATLPIYAATLSQGHADEDTAAVCAVLEKKAGLKRKRGR